MGLGHSVENVVGELQALMFLPGLQKLNSATRDSTANQFAQNVLDLDRHK